jgi:hypothetical protein
MRPLKDRTAYWFSVCAARDNASGLAGACGTGNPDAPPSPPGDLLNHAGDLDNRLKPLFDSLRVPQHLHELPDDGEPGEDEEPFFSLLEDDALVTRISVTTDRLVTPDRPLGEADLIVGVTVRRSWEDPNADCPLARLLRTPQYNGMKPSDIALAIVALLLFIWPTKVMLNSEPWTWLPALNGIAGIFCRRSRRRIGRAVVRVDSRIPSNARLRLKQPTFKSQGTNSKAGGYRGSFNSKYWSYWEGLNRSHDRFRPFLIWHLRNQEQ